MERNLNELIDEMITERINFYESTAPKNVNQPTGEIQACLENLYKNLNKDNQIYLRKLDNAICQQCGEDRFYFYKSGFTDALKLLLIL